MDIPVLKSMKYDTQEKGKVSAFLSDIKDLEGQKIFHAVVSSKSVDRDDEVLLPAGCNTNEFMRNPVMPDSHNYHGHSVGKVINLYITNDTIQVDHIFATETQDGKDLDYLYSNGFQKAYSVGFIRNNYVRVNEKTPDKFDVELTNGNRVNFDLTAYGDKRPRVITTEWELLEISPCVVGSNQDALVGAMARQFGVDSLKQQLGDSPTEIAMEHADNLLAEGLKKINDALKDFTNVHLIDLSAVPSHSTPINAEAGWEGSKAVTQLAKFASSDGSGDKEKINWTKFAKGFAWYDVANAENLTSYKFPHHYVEDGKLVAVWRGVVNAMVRLLGSYKGDDREGIYKHLAKHYQDADKPVPTLDKNYEDWELKFIENDINLGDVDVCDSIDYCDFDDGIDGAKPYPNEHACRVKEPYAFQEGSFRSVKRNHEGKGYRVIMGKLKDSDSMTTQAFRYPKDVWKASEAKSHCKDHGGNFESATTNSLPYQVVTGIGEKTDWDFTNLLYMRMGLDEIKQAIAESELSNRVKITMLQEDVKSLKDLININKPNNTSTTDNTEISPEDMSALMDILKGFKSVGDK